MAVDLAALELLGVWHLHRLQPGILEQVLGALEVSDKEKNIAELQLKAGACIVERLMRARPGDGGDEQPGNVLRSCSRQSCRLQVAAALWGHKGKT
jgi:hypothetical protein